MTAKKTVRKSKPSAKPSTKTQPETHTFQTEVQQLLHLIVHSLYGQKEIFLRELISNASDACDRLRFAALTDNTLLEGDALGIWIDADAQARTITIRDNGIGMNRDEVVDNIGTIAHSGTREFISQLSAEQAKDSALIGQFGVGFYSAFLVAEKVTLRTRRADASPDDGVQWVSDGGGEYTLDSLSRDARGTEIILQVRKECEEYLDATTLQRIIGKYSEHIALPIWIKKAALAEDDSQDESLVQVPAQTDADASADADIDQWQQVNQGAALWTRAKSDISAEQYNALYTALTFDPEPPAVTLHNRVEGKLEYISLLFIAARAPFDLWDRERRRGIKLYVRRIFIAEDAGQLMPNYLRFVRGLVDAADLPLNVSREFLQQNKQIEQIRAALVKKILAELAKIAAQDAARYANLWQQYGRALKEGVIEDPEQRDAVAKLLRFASTHDVDAGECVALQEYVQRMPMAQSAIYYLTADNLPAARTSPHLEVFNQHGIEVLLLTDAVDEWVVGHLPMFADKPLQSVAKGDLDIDALVKGGASTDNEAAKQNADSDAPSSSESENIDALIAKIKTALGDKVKDVRASKRLVDSPACIVADQHDLGANMERILQAVGQEAPAAKPILEINPQHAIIQQLNAYAGAHTVGDDKVDSDSDSDSDSKSKPDSDSIANAASDSVNDNAIDDWAHVLFDHAALAEGATLKNPGAYLTRINKLLIR